MRLTRMFRGAAVALVGVLLVIVAARLLDERSWLVAAFALPVTLITIGVVLGVVHGPARLNKARWQASRLLRKNPSLRYEASGTDWDQAFLTDLDNGEYWTERVVHYSAENVVTGFLGDDPVLAFDLRVEHQLIGRVHAVVAQPVGVVTGLVSVQPGRSDTLQTNGSVVELESSDFSRAFTVRSEDRRTAYDVLAPRVMEALLAARDGAGGRDLAWLFSDGHVVAIRLNCRLVPRDVVEARALLDPVVAALPRHLDALPSTTGMVRSGKHGRYRRQWPFWRRHLLTIGATLTVVALTLALASFSVHTAPEPPRGVWVMKDAQNRTAEWGAAWGARCPTVDLRLSELPPAAIAAVRQVADEAGRMGVHVTVTPLAGPPGADPPPSGPHVIISGSNAPYSRYGDRSEIFFTTTPSRPDHVVLRTVLDEWYLGRVGTMSTEDAALHYRQLARVAVAAGFGLWPRRDAPDDAAITLHPEHAADRWSTDDRRDLLTQSGCAKAPPRDA